ncbi:MAG: sulfatase [Halobacteriaceae archaeon]
MPDRPNVLILMSDQHRPDALGCAGNGAIHTPNFDRLARRGVVFEEAYTTSPLCGPARMSFLSGVYPHNTGILQNGGWQPADDPTFFQRLRDAGYYTAHVGKSHWGGGDFDHFDENEAFMRARGFEFVRETEGTGPATTEHTEHWVNEHWREAGHLGEFRADLARRRNESGFWSSPLPTEEHWDSVVSREALEFLSGYDRDEPFCLFVGWGGPHDPLDPPAEFAEMYDADEMPAPVESEPFGEWVPERAREFMEREGLAGPTQDEWPAERIEGANAGHMATTVTPEGYWRPPLDDAGWRELRKHYYGKVSLLDYWVGEFLDTLDARGDLEDTVVVYLSDHGEMAGDHGLVAKKTFYDASVRIPLIVSGPGFEDGVTTDALAEIIDIGPTLLDAADADPPGRSFGESLCPVLRGEGGVEREAVFSQVRGHTDNYKAMVATPDYKYAVDNDARGYMLFDREADPDERENLIGHPDYYEVERDLRERLLEFYHVTGTRFVNVGDGRHEILEPGLKDE